MYGPEPFLFKSTGVFSSIPEVIRPGMPNYEFICKGFNLTCLFSEGSCIKFDGDYSQESVHMTAELGFNSIYTLVISPTELHSTLFCRNRPGTGM